MADTSKKNVTKKSHMLNTKWLNNAIKSVSSSSVKAISEVAPTLSDLTISGANVTKNVLTSLRSGKSTMNNIGNQISSNRYIKFAQKAYTNALEDLKTGNLNNESRMEEALWGSDSDMGGGDFTFGDEDIDGESSSLTVNVDSGSDNFNAGLMELSKQINQNSVTMVKTAEANMNAQIATQSTLIFQMQKSSQEIIGRLDNISAGINALVSYNNETMTKFVEASMGYYERMGSTVAPIGGSGSSTPKVDAGSIFGSNGRFNKDAYKQYFKDQIKNIGKKSGAGMIDSLLDDNMLDMIAANPLGTGLDIAVKAMMPKLLTTTLTEIEDQFTNLTASFLHNLADWGDKDDGTPMGKLKQYIGQIAGIKGERTKSYDKKAAIVQKGPVPFDSETKTAITQVITKELSEQTTYLRIISESIGGTKKGRKYGSNRKNPEFKYYNYSTGEYQSTDEITDNIINTVKDNILSEMNNTRFGETIRRDLLSAQGDVDGKQYKDMEKAINKFMLLAMKDGRAVNLRDKSANSRMSKIRSKFGNSDVENALFEFLENLELYDPATANNLSVAILKGTDANNNTLKDIMENPISYNLMNASKLVGDDKKDELFDRILSQYGDADEFKGSKAAKFKRPDNQSTSSSRSQVFADMSKSFMGRMNAMSKNMFRGNLEGTTKEFGKMIGDQVAILGNVMTDKFLMPIKKSMFGVKDDNGTRNGGIFSDTLNSITDMTRHLRHEITGKSIKLTDGTTLDETDDAVFGQFRVLGRQMKEFIFGKKGKADENGNITGNTEGVIQKFTKSMKEGFTGWMDALFGPEVKPGEELTEEEYNKRSKENREKFYNKFKKSLPKGVAGAAAGLGFGTLSGGILGNLVGGPIGGAILGSVVGFASSSEKFNEWLFGAKDEEGNQITEGLISSKTQKFFKDNKTFFLGTGLAGTAIGTVTGAGVLGNLVGGPVGGALLGLGAGIVSKSDMFKRFLFGDKEKGQTGILQMVKNSFGKFDWGIDGEAKGTGKMFGMSAIGAGAGALTIGTLMNSGVLGLALGPAGPIGGAVLGLGLSIAAQKDNFKKWLFGEKDENGKKTKEGILGQAKNALKVHMLNPLITAGKNLGRNFKTFFEYSILDNIRFAFQPLTDLIASATHGMKDAVTGLFKKGGDLLKKNIVGPAIKLATYPIRKAAETASMLTNAALTKVADKVADAVSGLTAFMANSVKKIGSSMFNGAKKVLGAGGKLAGKIFGFEDDDETTSKSKVRKGLRNLSKGFGGKFSSVKSKLNDIILESDVNVDKVNDILRRKAEIEEAGGKFKPTLKEQRLLSRYYRAEQRKADKKAHKEDLAHNAMSDLIAELTNNQYADDNEEGRAAALDAIRRMKPGRARDKYEAKFAKFTENLAPIVTQQEALMKAKAAKEERGEQREEQIADNTKDIRDMLAKHFALNGSNSADVSQLPDSIQEKLAKGKPLSKKELKKVHKFVKKQNKLNNALSDDADASIADGLENGDIKNAYADGTESADAGLSVVGENGPEIVHMLGGEKVVPNSKVAEYLKDRKRATVNKQKNELNIKNARERGITTEEKIKADKEAERDQVFKDILATLKQSGQVAKEHVENWNKTFDLKKGLIGLLFLKFGPTIFKMLANLDWEAILNAIKNFGGAILDFLNLNSEDAKWTEENDARTDGKSEAKMIEENAKRGLDIFDKNGNWDHSSGARLKAAVAVPAGIVANLGKKWTMKKNVKNATKALASKYGDNVVTAIGGKVLGSYNGVKDIAKQTVSSAKGLAKMPGKIAGGAKKAASATASAVTNLADDVGKKGIIQTVIDGLKKCFELVKEKLLKAGHKAAQSSMDDIVDDAVKFATKNADDVAKKAGPIVAGRTGITATGVGVLVDVGIIGLSALNGATGAARLFQIDPESVTPLMVLISTAFGALTGTTIGSVFDVVNEIYASVKGVSLLSNAATALYRAISSDENDKALEEAQAKFKEEYLDYKGNKIDEQYNNMMKAGLLDANMTKDEFTEKVQNGELSASYDSFMDYNDQQHKTLFGKIGDTVTSGAKALKRNTWDKVFGTKTVSYTDEKTGQKYVKNSDGTYDVYDKNGNLMKNDDGSNVTVNEDNIKDLGFAKNEGRQGSIFAKENLANTAKGAAKMGLKTLLMGPAGLASSMLDTLTDGTEFGKKYDAMKAAVSNKLTETLDGGLKKVTEWFNKGSEASVKKGKLGTAALLKGGALAASSVATLISGKNKVTIFRDVTNPTNYYRYNETNKCWDYYNAMDSIISSKSGLTQEEMDDLIENNLVSEDTFVENLDLKQRLTKVKDNITNEVKKISEAGAKAWDKFKSLFSGGGSGSGNVFSTFFGSDSTNKAMAGGSGRGRLRGGRGNMNGFPYYSQEDPAWGNMAYGNDGATMADTGCGPTAMSMIASHFGGSGSSPVDMANLAQMTGDRDETGTNFNFIDKASAIYGINNTKEYMPSGDYIASNLAAGNPMILSGASGKGRVPYTPAGHYVVATGIDNNGNVSVNDPRGKQYSGKYNINDLTNSTSAAWAFGGKGRRGLRGGRGLERAEAYNARDERLISQKSGVTANDVIIAARNEIGYVEKASNKDLDIKEANPGENNFTKYNVVVFGSPQAYWCASFTCWCFYAAAGKNKEMVKELLCGPMSASCQTLLNQFRKANRYSQTPEKGDLIFFHYSRNNTETNHVGIVAEVSGNNVITIEGNTSAKANSGEAARNGGTVAQKTHPIGDKSIVGYGHPMYAGTSAKLYDASFSSSSDGSAGYYSSDSSASVSSSGSSGGLWGIFDVLGNVFSDLATKAWGGTVETSSSSSGSSSGSYSSYTGDSSSSGAIATSGANISGSNNGKKIWNYFKKKNMPDAGIAALMGNLYAESHLAPNNLQDTYNKSIGLSDEEYSNQVTKGTYGKFVNDSAGYGLAQWTYSSRKKGLLDMARRSNLPIDDIGLQLDYLNSELNSNYKSVNQALYNAKDIKTASNVVLHDFENPEKQGSDVEALRASYGQKMMDLYGGGSGRGFRRGGRGANVVSTKPNFRASYSPQTAERFISNTSNHGGNGTGNNSQVMNQFMSLVVSALTEIAKNTGTTSSNIAALEGMGSSSVNNMSSNTNNMIVSAGGKTAKTSNQTSKSSAGSKNSNLAFQIAKGK